MNTDMFSFKDAELWLSDLADILRKEYGNNEEFEKEFIPQMEYLEGIEVELVSELYRITQYMQNNGAFERWKVKGLEIAIMKYLVALHESGMAEIDDDSAFVAGLRMVRTMCERYVEILQAINEHIGEEPQHGNENNSTIELPEEQNGLNEQNFERNDIPTLYGTEKEMMVFERALQKGYMKVYGGGYKWNLHITQLAYMCGRLYCNDKIKEDDNGDRIYRKGFTQMPATKIRSLFCGTDVGGNRNVLTNPPREFWVIDELFKNEGASR